MYQKQNFVKGQKLKAEQLNHMEEGIAKAHEQSGGAGVTIELLWMNSNPINTDDDSLNEFESAEINFEAKKCDIVEAVFLVGIEEEITVRVHRGASSARASYFKFTQDGVEEYRRIISVNWSNAIIYINNCDLIGTSFDGQGGGSSIQNNRLVPLRIYGIKGVDTSSFDEGFNISGYGTFSFMDGMTWSDWCNSPYNTINLYLNHDLWAIKHDESDSTLGYSDGTYVDPDDNIEVDGQYELL